MTINISPGIRNYQTYSNIFQTQRKRKKLVDLNSNQWDTKRIEYGILVDTFQAGKYHSHKRPNKCGSRWGNGHCAGIGLKIAESAQQTGPKTIPLPLYSYSL